MGARRRWIRRTLAALLALVVLGAVGAGVWAASTDDDQPGEALLGSPSGESDAEDVAPSEQPAPGEPTAPSEPPEPTAPTDGAPPPAPAEPVPTETAPEPELGEPERTRVPRERREDPDQRGKRFVVPPAREFTGTGNALIGTVIVREPVVVRWRARGRFGLEFGREAFPIVAPSRSGQLVVPPFRFDLVRVLAGGRWTITVTPQS